MHYLIYKKFNTTLQQHHPHIKRKVTSTQLGPIGKATHFLILRAQRFTCEVQQSGVPPLFLCQDGGDGTFFCKIVFNFLYFWTLHCGLHPKTEWCKSNYFLHFHSLTFYRLLHWHFDCFIQRRSLKWCNKVFLRRLSIVLLCTTQKSRYIFMIFVSMITLASKAFVLECDEICYAIAVNVWAEPL